MRRKLFTFAVLLVTTLSSVPTPAYALFNDIPQGSPFLDAFHYLNQNGIVHGFNDGTARPQAFLNRAEALKVILRSKETFAPEIVWFESNMPAISLFPDVVQSEWYAVYVEVGFLEKIITGYPDGTMRPGNNLTVAEALAMLHRTYGEEQFPYSESFSLGNNPNQWYTNAVSMANSRNLVMRGASLRLDQPITR